MKRLTFFVFTGLSLGRVPALRADPFSVLEVCDEWCGRRHGECVSINLDGKVRQQARYQHGVLHGPQTVFGENGKPIERLSYRMGVLQGDWRRFNSDGTEVLTGRFEQGRLEGTVSRFDGKGNRIAVSEYVRGRRDGLETYYYPNGWVAGRIEYRGAEAIARP